MLPNLIQLVPFANPFLCVFFISSFLCLISSHHLFSVCSLFSSPFISTHFSSFLSFPRIFSSSIFFFTILFHFPLLSSRLFSSFLLHSLLLHTILFSSPLSPNRMLTSFSKCSLSVSSVQWTEMHYLAGELSSISCT